MASAGTTTLRVPVELRDEIARLAQQRGTTMLDVVTDAIRRLGQDQWWDSVHDALGQMAPEAVTEYRAEARRRRVRPGCRREGWSSGTWSRISMRVQGGTKRKRSRSVPGEFRVAQPVVVVRMWVVEGVVQAPTFFTA